MISFVEIRSEWFGPVTLAVGEGVLAKAAAGSREAAAGFVKTAAGLVKPLSGRAFLFGQDIHAAAEEDYIRMMARVGVTAEGWGIISNLRAWENAALPALYHGRMTIAELEKFTGEAFLAMGIGAEEGEAMMRLPVSSLKPWQDKILKLIRAYSMNPDLLLLEEITTGLPGDIQKNVIQWILKLHKEKPGRATLLVSEEESSLMSIPAQTIFLPR